MEEIKGIFGFVFFFLFHDGEGFPGESGATDILWIESEIFIIQCPSQGA